MAYALAKMLICWLLRMRRRLQPSSGNSHAINKALKLH